MPRPSYSRKPTVPQCEEHQQLFVTEWGVVTKHYLDGDLWCLSWSRISHQWKTKALQSASSETGSPDLPTSRDSWFHWSCLHTWLCGSSSFCAGFPKPAFPEEAPSPLTTSSASWLMKLIYCRARSGGIRDPVQATHLYPAPVPYLQTNGGCILRPVPHMTHLHLRTSFPPPFLSTRWETCVAAVSMGLPLANFWMERRSGSLLRLLLMTLSEAVGL